MGTWLESVWADAKSWREFRFGPISLLLRLARSGPRPRRLRTPDAKPAARQANCDERPASCPPPESTAPLLGSVLIVGVGRGVGATAARFFAHRSRGVAIVARSPDFLLQVQQHCAGSPASVLAFPVDVTNERATCRVIDEVTTALGAPDLVIYAVQTAFPGDVLSTQVSALEESWRGTCLGAFIVAREVGRRMRDRGSGTIIFTGSSSGLVARAGYLNLAVGKHGLRALAHIMAKELGPLGVHVVHCVIDADVNEGEPPDGVQMDPEHLASMFLALHQQPDSCWTAELDVRPAKEGFWEHC